MFNEERKLQFISEYTGITAPGFLSNLFKKTEIYENILKKDVCDFVLAQIADLLKSFGSLSIETVRVNVSLLRTYTRWCSDRNMLFDGQNHFDEVDSEIIENSINKIAASKKYPTREQILKYADELTNVCDSMILLGVFEGIGGDKYSELLNLTEDCIDKKEHNRLNLVSGRSILVSDKLISLIRASVREYDYYSTKEGSFFVMRLKADSDLAIKPRDNTVNETKDAKYERLLGRIAKIKKEIGYSELSLPRLKNGGIIEAIKDVLKKHRLTLEEFLKSGYCNEIKEHYDIRKPAYQVVYQFRDFLE